jgi:DNA-binding NtrC family response regulator
MIVFQPLDPTEGAFQQLCFDQEDSAVLPVETEFHLLELVGQYSPGCAVVLCGELAGSDVLQLAERVRQIDKNCPLLFLNSTGISALNPTDRNDEVVGFLERSIGLGETNSALLAMSMGERLRIRKTVSPELVEGNRLAGSGPAAARIRSQIAKIAATNANVLITGESGTGKDLAAELIHKNSARRLRKFVAVNCAAVPESLLESELFGHVRGAFTGANTARAGKLEHAAGGTLFLDEIGDMSLVAQAKILRAVETRVIQRLGSNVDTPIEVRLIAATNQDLELLMRTRRFRQDLYFRLNVVRLNLPPLRDRREDIPELVEKILQELAHQQGTPARRIDCEVLGRLQAHDWPGNIRELRNVVESIVVFSSSSAIGISDIPRDIRQTLRSCSLTSADERGKILTALVSTGWNRNRAAEILHCSRMTLYRKMVRLSIGSDPQ